MKLGIVVPAFRASAQPALAVADAAVEFGLDGLFVTDHLWSPHKPGPGPAQAALPLLAALAARCKDVSVGTLVVRVGVVANDVLYDQLMQIQEVAGGRFIAGLGIGDKLSAPENAAYGLAPKSRPERLELLSALAERLVRAGAVVWLGGRSSAIREIAEQTGATVNQWECEPDELRAGDTWGGMFREASQVDEISERGVEWAVFGIRGSAESPRKAVDMLSGARAH